mmetsp:Transcript_59964/g.141405  ORF Transcript_59964/g.141405 Transcript_59964/m.141405 type:complete len:269 (+) Transcript_59964:100-906(+)
MSLTGPRREIRKPCPNSLVAWDDGGGEQAELRVEAPGQKDLLLLIKHKARPVQPRVVVGGAPHSVRAGQRRSVFRGRIGGADVCDTGGVEDTQPDLELLGLHELAEAALHHMHSPLVLGVAQRREVARLHTLPHRRARGPRVRRRREGHLADLGLGVGGGEVLCLELDGEGAREGGHGGGVVVGDGVEEREVEVVGAPPMPGPREHLDLGQRARLGEHARHLLPQICAVAGVREGVWGAVVGLRGLSVRAANVILATLGSGEVPAGGF